MPKLVLVSLKSFGDFVIACNALRTLNLIFGSQQVSVLAGEHLYPLASALEAVSSIQFIASGPSVPAIFDLKRWGAWDGLMSLLELRRQFSALPKKDRLIFDRLGWREMCLAQGIPHAALPEAPNIYLAYERVLLSAGFMQPDRANPPRRVAQDCALGTAMIFPSSRISRKSVPSGVVRALYKNLTGKGVPCEVVILEAEDFDAPSGIPVRNIPRNFTSLIETIRSASMVFSADSLPAHLAEYYQVPAFVITPTPNAYWLPRSAFENRAWALFSEIVDSNALLARFLSRAGTGS